MSVCFPALLPVAGSWLNTYPFEIAFLFRAFTLTSHLEASLLRI
jgi:hypothetical protein